MAKEYIERDALIAEFKRLTLGENSLVERMFADGVYAVLETFPAADVVEVVRCKDCIHRLQGGYCKTIADCRATKAVNDNFFCGYGERRTDDGNKENL